MLCYVMLCYVMFLIFTIPFLLPRQFHFHFNFYFCFCSCFQFCFYFAVPALSALGCAILASVVADWSLSIASNSLWMDSRVSARKALFSSLPLLIDRASQALIRPILFTDSYLHDQDDKHLFDSNSVEEQVYSYLSEASTTCMAALCAETPGLDPHSVGCLLKALRLCRTCPEVVVEDRRSDSTSFCREADEREREGHTEREGDRGSLEKNPLFSHFRNAITAYALKYCDVRTSTVTSDDDVIIGNPFQAIGELSHGSSSRPMQVENEKEEKVMREEVECEEAEFSDWDEEEDSENEHVNRRGTLYPCDDLTALQDEIEMLQCHYEFSVTNFH